jgi:hypothetical protein
MVAGAIVPAKSSWAALMVLYTAWVRYGVPECLISDSGGAFTSNEFEAVCTRLGIDHQTIVSTQGESYLNWMETHFNVQRRLFDYQLSLAKTSVELEQVHQTFLQLYNTTAHQGLLNDRFIPPIPLEVLGEAKGRLYSEEELASKFSHALFPRTTNRYGCVSLHSYTSSMWNGACLKPGCCYGCMTSSCGRCLTMSFWRNTAAVMIGRPIRCEISTVGCFTRPRSHRHRVY